MRWKGLRRYESTGDTRRRRHKADDHQRRSARAVGGRRLPGSAIAHGSLGANPSSVDGADPGVSGGGVVSAPKTSGYITSPSNAVIDELLYCARRGKRRRQLIGQVQHAARYVRPSVPLPHLIPHLSSFFFTRRNTRRGPQLVNLPHVRYREITVSNSSRLLYDGVPS